MQKLVSLSSLYVENSLTFACKLTGRWCNFRWEAVHLSTRVNAFPGKRHCIHRKVLLNGFPKGEERSVYCWLLSSETWTTSVKMYARGSCFCVYGKYRKGMWIIFSVLSCIWNRFVFRLWLYSSFVTLNRPTGCNQWHYWLIGNTNCQQVTKCYTVRGVELCKAKYSKMLRKTIECLPFFIRIYK